MHEIDSTIPIWNKVCLVTQYDISIEQNLYSKYVIQQVHSKIFTHYIYSTVLLTSAMLMLHLQYITNGQVFMERSSTARICKPFKGIVARDEFF
jgi:hypothetical protein